jgi:hypothetical protein
LRRQSDGSTNLRFRHRLEKHKLADRNLSAVNELLVQRGLLFKVGTALDTTLIASPCVFGTCDSHGICKRKKLDKESKHVRWSD